MWVSTQTTVFYNSYYCRQYMGKDRPLELKNKIDPRIKKAEDENAILKISRY